MNKFPEWYKCPCNKPACETVMRDTNDGGKIVLVPEWAGYSAMCIPDSSNWTPRPVSYEEVIELTDEWAKQKGGWKS